MDLFGVDHEWAFLALLPVVAFLYASVGHGGASGYLALMALFSFSSLVMRPNALLLNLLVAGLAFWHYWRKGHFKLQLFTSFAVTSIPMAFVGGLLEVDEVIYKRILGVLLLFAVGRMINLFGPSNIGVRELRVWQGLLIGAAIGFLSGLIGIGGGIILTPVILLLGWGNVKQAAAVSALFIWVNSLAGLGGQLSQGVRFESDVLILLGLAGVGGFFGAMLGSGQWNTRTLKLVLAAVLLLASAKLLLV